MSIEFLSTSFGIEKFSISKKGEIVPHSNGTEIDIYLLMNKFRQSLALSRERFFLKRYYPSKPTRQLLKDLYPKVNWKRVRFYEGLPWFTHFVAPYVTAQALPDFYSFGRYKIYLIKFDESRAQCLADIVHEGFHVMQAMEFLNGYGLGFLRGLMIYYNALYFKYGYRSNPFEIPAFDQEFRFLDYCSKHGLHGIIPKVDPNKLKHIYEDSGMVFRKHEFRYKENYLVLAGSFVVCLLIAVLRPILDLLIFLVSLAGKKKTGTLS